ncbi:MAG: formylglycine-generating enzyme family protein [Acidobacteriota bacterium]|nr:formylglycine-generating enzyme family protein [Acidobacteriota bacterium]
MIKRNVTIKLLFIFSLSLILFGESKAQNSDAPLTLFNIEKALRSTKISLKERNRLLIEGVKERGITFTDLSPKVINKLFGLGASKQLLEVIIEKYPTLPPLAQLKMERGDNPFQMNNSFDMEFRLIPKGEFTMGAKATEPGSLANEKPQRKVKIPQHFFIGQYEVTQKQWNAIMGDNPSQNKQCGDDCPVDSVSWNDVQEFIKKLNAKKGANDSYTYRLPTEAEWEYAARALTETRYYWGDDDDEKIWRLYAHSNDKTAVSVGSYLPNNFGLFDTSGNVWELVEDVWHTDFSKAKNDGSSNVVGDSKERVMKGGSVSQFLDELRPARRGKISTTAAMNNVGFRLAAIPKKP